MPSSKPGVIVQGSGLNALGVVRSLAPERVKIKLIDEGPGGPAIASRHVAPTLYGPGDDRAQALIDAICTAAATFDEPPVLILTQEFAVAACCTHRDVLAGKVRMELPETKVALDLMDKTQFQRIAEGRGFPVPRAVQIDGEVALHAAATLTYPCILKPAHKSDDWERHYKKAYRFESFADLERFWRALERPPALIVQEWIEGGDADVYFTLVQRGADGTHLAFTGRKIRQWPPLVGGTASCMPAPEGAAELEPLTHRFFEAVGLIGLASMEYKRDTRSHRFVMVEPTIGRTDYQEEIATLNGVNLVRAAYRSMANLPPCPIGPKPPATIWSDAESDAKSRAALADATPPAEANAMPITDATFRADDPGPWLKGQMSRVTRRFRRLFR